MQRKGTFKSLSLRLEEIEEKREQAAVDDFDYLEMRLSWFSEMLVNGFGDRSRAIRRMCIRQRNLDGRNGYQVLADGEWDRLWDELERACGFLGSVTNYGAN